jgi:hypothetical protein
MPATRATGSHSTAPDIAINASSSPAYQPYGGVVINIASPTMTTALSSGRAGSACRTTHQAAATNSSVAAVVAMARGRTGSSSRKRRPLA